MPHIAWRAGLDLYPLDVTNSDEVEWLETLVWPEQFNRLANLRAALDIARRNTPRVSPGDLRHDLAALAREAPSGATLVIFHTAVLSYLTSQADKDAFAVSVRQLTRHWISNESPSVFPNLASPSRRLTGDGRLVLALDGIPVAWTDPHGASLTWLSRTSESKSKNSSD